jgi:UDP-N-acetylmuramate dehydrogenase
MTEGFNGITWLDKTKAVVGAGVKLSQLLNGCKERGLGGLEFACGIPGTVGGGVAMNAGAYGGEMKDVVDGVEIAGKKGQRGFLSKTELNFSYRRAEMPRGAVIVRAHMSFVSRTPEEIGEKIKEFRERRKASAQITSPSAGSIFKNPEGLSAGKLIEEAGFKGMRLGGAKVSEAHANYIVNEDGAKAKDVLALMAEIRDKVYAKTGVLLEPEIKVLGED